jgi:hypothetical protein
MSQTAAHLVDHVIPHVPVRQWVPSLPIPLRVLLAAQPELVTPVLQVVQRMVERHLLDYTGLKSDEGQGGAVKLIQRFGSAANLNIHLHWLVLDGVYRCNGDGKPTFVEADAPTDDEVHALLQTLIARLMKMLTRRVVLVEDMGQTCLTDPDTECEEARRLRPSGSTHVVGPVCARQGPTIAAMTIASCTARRLPNNERSEKRRASCRAGARALRGGAGSGRALRVCAGCGAVAAAGLLATLSRWASACASASRPSSVSGSASVGGVLPRRRLSTN